MIKVLSIALCSAVLFGNSASANSQNRSATRSDAGSKSLACSEARDRCLKNAQSDTARQDCSTSWSRCIQMIDAYNSKAR